MLKITSLTFVTLVALLAASTLASPQQVHLPPSVSQGPGMGQVPITSGDSVQQRQAKAANEQRQVEIKRDTEKMYQLTAELKQSLETSGPSVMSMDDLKKVEQIEKLAHGVKSKMKQSL
jgi:hypothetical protein